MMDFIKKIKIKLSSQDFLKSVLTITSGTIIAQLVTILLSPVISRLYTPNDLGLLATYTALAAIFGTIITGRYEQAIVLPESEEECNSVFILGCIISIVFSLIITLICILFHKPIIQLLKIDDISLIWFFLLGLYILFIGFDALLNRLAIRRKDFRVQAETQVTQQITTNAFKIIIGFIKKSSMGLFIGTFLGQIARCIRLFLAERKFIFAKENRVNKKQIIDSAIRYKKFPLINSWSGLINVASAQLPVILFTSIFSTEISGYYSFSFRILNLPMLFIGQSVSNVFLERAAKAKNDLNELGTITIKLYDKLLFIGSILLSIVTFYGDFLFSFVFGNSWTMAGNFSRWISVWIVFQLAISPLSSVFIVVEKQGEGLFWNIILFVTRLSFLFIMPFTDDIVLLIAIYSIISAIFYFIFSIRVLTFTKQKISMILKIFLKSFVLIYLIQGGISVLIRSIIIQ